MYPHLPTWFSKPGLTVVRFKLHPPQVSEISGDLGSEPKGSEKLGSPTPIGLFCTDLSQSLWPG